VKFSAFNPFPVYGTEADPAQWPVPPRHCVPGSAGAGLERAWELCDLADTLGFDYVSVAEHHYHPRQMTPNPLVMAAALSQRLRCAGVAVLGVDLPLTNPLRTAEEIALLDVLSGGRLLVGLFRGAPNEFLAYGTDPYRSREAYEEALDLVRAAWTEPEPFAWIGRHHEYRTVAVWPRPVQQPHPPILVAGNSPASARYAARQRCRLGLSFVPAARAAELVAVYRAEAHAVGWEPAAEDVLCRQFALVAETDDEAGSLVLRYGYGDLSGMRAISDPRVSRELARAMGGAPPPSTVDGLPERPMFAGSPDTVAVQVAAFVEATGVGMLDLAFNELNLPFAHARRSLELFGREVLPRTAGR
jgi:alkanesulfonate monooxygenase SsuD/methylene tetrahydromethanopterin reductase-like flavin-dependent oxidoreductase (luciferase family)